MGISVIHGILLILVMIKCENLPQHKIARDQISLTKNRDKILACLILPQWYLEVTQNKFKMDSFDFNLCTHIVWHDYYDDERGRCHSVNCDATEPFK